jgi:hypothetical protein
MFDCKMVKASIGPAGIPLYSLVATYPRFIHAEIMTHRDKARNAASSRAIPWKRKGKTRKRSQEIAKGEILIGNGQFGEITLREDDTYEYYVHNCMYSMIQRDPVIPMFLGMEKPGMQAGEELQGQDRIDTIADILLMRDFCSNMVDRMAARGLHKSICNRYLEPWMWITVLISGTEWKNFFRLRCHSAAERHFQHIAGMMREEIRNAKPQELKAGQWHLPYFELTDAIELARRGIGAVDPLTAPKISAGRCARLSYLTQEGERDIAKDIKLADQLIDPPTAGLDEDVMHASPLEHPSEAMTDPTIRSGPYRGWRQLRKYFPRENVEG